MSQFLKQKHFMHTFGMPVPQAPALDIPSAVLWSRLINEEFAEFDEAFDNFGEDPDSDELAAELTAEIADVIYVLAGFAHSQGLPLEEMYNAIHAANMRKVTDTGHVIRNEAGKVMKPEGWYPADKVGVIRRAKEQVAHGS